MMIRLMAQTHSIPAGTGTGVKTSAGIMSCSFQMFCKFLLSVVYPDSVIRKFHCFVESQTSLSEQTLQAEDFHILLFKGYTLENK